MAVRTQTPFDTMWNRRQFLKRAGLGSAALLSAGSLFEFLEACGGTTPTPAAGNVKVTWTNVVIPENLDPHIGFDTDTLQFTQNVYEALLEYTPGGLDVRPLLAESYSVSSDGLAYTFKIRQGITFHDGAKLDSQAVLTSFQRLQEINQGPASYLINIAGFEAPDPSTFVIKLSAPYSLFPGTVPWFLITSPNAVSTNKSSSDTLAKNWFASNSAGTGPYMLQSFQPNLRIDLTQNKHYWRTFNAGVPIAASMTQNANTTTQLELLQSGQSDFLINIGPDNAAEAKTLSNLAVIRQPAIQLRTIPLNMIRTPLTDIRVRQALIAAFDYDGYTNFYKGFGRPANSPIPPQFPGWDSTLPYAKQDLATAKQLLTAAGVPAGTQMRMVTVQGLNYESFAGTIFQAALAKIGIDLKVEAPPWPQIPPQMANNSISPPMTFLNVFPNTPDPALVIRVSYDSSNLPSKGGYNWANYADPTLDANLDKVVQIQDASQRNTLLSQMQKQIVDAANTIFCIAPDLVVPVRKEWAHVKYDPFFQDGIVRWFYWSKGA
ncbi:MAG TPA: ABC transporter substrate-binding protein [Candidatus Micrarchaeaceae archaeon]|nr:ABC transporter substrate-binding protein [Candidatus Micrarchaeaceae archaeon]